VIATQTPTRFTQSPAHRPGFFVPGSPPQKPTHTMAIKLIANYAKRLGLPGYSSHQFSVTCETELTDLAQAPAESSRLYDLLQEAVDREIQQTGFVPDDSYGLHPAPNGRGYNPGRSQGPNGHGPNGRVNGHSNGGGPASRRGTAPVNGNGAWHCSDKQRRLLGDLSRELQLSEEDLDERAVRLFQRPARQLNKLNASGLITDLLDEAEGLRQANGSDHGKPRSHRNGGAA
jgi:hypothetical protein